MEESKKEKVIQICKLILRILIGLFFIATAILKLWSLERFELYIYSFNIFNYFWSGLAARAVIACELFVGGMLIAKIKYREIWWLTMTMLLAFTLLLIYSAIFRHDSNCHCMGDLVKVSPGWSILKNAIIAGLMLLIRNESDYSYKGKIAVGILLTITSLAVPYILFPTDNVYNRLFKAEIIDTKEFDQFMSDSLAQTMNLNHGEYIVAYISAGCDFCKIGTQKLKSIIDKHQLNQDRIIYFIWGKDKTIETFKKETDTDDFQYTKIDPTTSIRITNGKFPTFLFVRDGKIIKNADLRGLDEQYIISFISQ